MITVLGVASNSVYKGLEVEWYDKNRDLRNYEGKGPVITHAPCRLWSRSAHRSTAPESERELAVICANHVKNNGGIFEHPAHSRIFGSELPLPGEGTKKLYTISIWQSWFGFRVKKPTWLTFSKIDKCQIDIPFELYRYDEWDKKWMTHMSVNQRSRTTEKFALWMIDLVKKVDGYRADRSTGDS